MSQAADDSMSSRPFVDVIFGPYAPDWGGMPRPEAPGYLVDAINVRSTPNGYRGMPSFSTIASATVIGAVSCGAPGLGAHFYDPTSGDIFYFGHPTSGKIWESRAQGTDTWLDVTPAAGTYSPQNADLFQYRGDVIFVSTPHAPVKKTLSATQATLFTNLGGSPPLASYGARVREHVVLGGLGASLPYDVRWSAIGNHEDWPTPGTADALAKEAGTQSLPSELGPITRIIGGEKIGIVVQENGLTRMTYIGGSAVYEFDTFYTAVGANLRVSSDGVLFYWLCDRGFFRTDGYQVQRLSEGLVDEAFFSNTISHADASDVISGGAYTVAYDSRRQLTLIGNNATHRLSFNTSDGSFSLTGDAEIQTIFTGHYGFSEAIYNISSTTRKLQKWNGATGSIAIQTGYMEVLPGYRIQLTGAHLLGTSVPGSLTLAYKSTSSLGSVNVAQSGFTSLTAPTRGMKAVGRASDQFFSFRITGTGAESQLIRGIRIYYENAEPAV